MTTENRERAQAYRNRLFPGFDSPLACTDPEFVERMDNFAFGEVPASDDLDDRTRMMAILAALIGAQAIDLFKAMAKGAFNVGVTSVEMKELVYQSTPYVGMGRMLPFLYAVNELLEHRLVSLARRSRSTCSARIWPTSTSRVPRKRAISTAGWPRTASAITTRARG